MSGSMADHIPLNLCNLAYPVPFSAYLFFPILLRHSHFKMEKVVPCYLALHVAAYICLWQAFTEESSVMEPKLYVEPRFAHVKPSAAAMPWLTVLSMLTLSPSSLSPTLACFLCYTGVTCTLTSYFQVFKSSNFN